MNRDDSATNSYSHQDSIHQDRSNGAVSELSDIKTALPVILNDELVPLTSEGRYVPNHLDTKGVVHWFSIVEAESGANPNAEPYQMRYYRATRDAQGEPTFDSYPVLPLTRADWSPSPLPLLEMMLEDGDLTAAQTLASGTAELHGFPALDLTQLRSLGEIETETTNSKTQIDQFRGHFGHSAYRLLEPVDPLVNYSFEVIAAAPWTEELTANKWWFGETGRIEHDSVTLATYSVDWPQFEKELEHEHALIDRDTLYRTHQEEGLEAAMQRAEGIGLIYGELDPHRADGRLFHLGPPDRFTTRREAELSTLNEPPSIDQVVQFVPDAAESLVSPEPGSWEELFNLPNNSEPEVDRHYWQLWIRPVETADGTSLGHALFCTEFPELPPDSDQHLDKFGMEDSIYPTEARTVEMADFRTEAEARSFGDEFRKYLAPDVIDGPDLAPDVAKLEGLSGDWAAINYDDIVRYMSGGDPVIRDKSDWHVHRPYSELDAEQSSEMQHFGSTMESEASGQPTGDEIIDTSIPPLEF